jgi:AbrB family looped-hinge helix DNA binding protein
MTASSDLVFKKVKVSDKGQISIPIEVQREMGIKKGDELLLIRKGRKIILEKPEKIAVILEDEFADLPVLSEESLKELWLGKGDDVWDQYLSEGKK